MLVHDLLTNQAHDAEALMSREGIERWQKRQTKLLKQGAAAERDDYSFVIRRSLLDVIGRVNAAIDAEEAKGARG